MPDLRHARSPRFLMLGATAAGLGAPALLSGCQEAPPPPPPPAPPTEQAVAQKGVALVVREQEDGSFQIDDEEIVDGPSKTLIVYADGRTETITDPDAFAAKLPAEPPPEGAYAGAPRSAFGLGDVLLMSMLFNAWSPARYGGRTYAAAPGALSQRAASGRGQRLSTFAAYQRRGVAPTGAASARSLRQAAQRAPAARSNAPRSGRSGFGRGFGSGTGRGFGG